MRDLPALSPEAVDQKPNSYESHNVRRPFTPKSGERLNGPCTPSAGHIPLKDSESSQRTVRIFRQTPDITVRSSPPPQFGPILSLPVKKREGYGFSYSESFFQDSDECPDSDEWDPEEAEYQPAKPASTLAASAHQRSLKASSGMKMASPPRRSFADGQPTFSQLSFSSTASTVGGDSSDDVVVMRDIGSFHVATPQRALTCTAATREDTMRVKAQGKRLLEKYAESAGVQERLLGRLERMVLVAQDRASLHKTKLPSISSLALKIQSFLLQTRRERVETGELSSVVDHEVEWAKWLVHASQRGVMHLRTKGCNCGPTWEDEK